MCTEFTILKPQTDVSIPFNLVTGGRSEATSRSTSCCDPVDIPNHPYCRFRTNTLNACKGQSAAYEGMLLN